MTGDQDNLTNRDGLWPMVYQGLGVYREPVQRRAAPPLAPHASGALPAEAALCGLPSLDSIPHAHPNFDTGTPVIP